jgi:hypothetical protein
MWIRIGLGAGVTAVVTVLGVRSTVSASPPQQRPPPQLVSTLPGDLPPNATQADAVDFAWRSFVAINWPALAGARGMPDPRKRIGVPGPVVWHTWKQPEEVFYADGRRPPGWTVYGDSLPAQCSGARRGDVVLHRRSKVPGAATGNDALEAAKEAVGGTLTDQRGNLARFEVRLNRPSFDAIVANRWYNVRGQDSAKSVSFPASVVEVKAAWRVMAPADSPAVRARFLRRTAWVYTAGGGTQPTTCVRREVGLVGLHIAQKTQSRPQWVWATFEHVDNVPPFNAAPPPGRAVPYSFNNPACPEAKCPPNQSTERNGVPTGKPTQVTRRVNIGQAAQQANPQWRQALAQFVAGSPLQFYQLVDVQWPQLPRQPPYGNPTPVLVANTTMETYVAESSCLKCHYTATTQSGKLSSDFSFLLVEAQGGTTASPKVRR